MPGTPTRSRPRPFPLSVLLGLNSASLVHWRQRWRLSQEYPHEPWRWETSWTGELRPHRRWRKQGRLLLTHVLLVCVAGCLGVALYRSDRFDLLPVLLGLPAVGGYDGAADANDDVARRRPLLLGPGGLL
jgi:hypothetical protein